MTGFTKRTVDKYIRNRIQYWIYDLGRNAHTFLKKELNLSTNDKEKLTAEDKIEILAFQKLVKANVVVTGGCFTSMLLGEVPNDLDIYVKDKNVAANICWFYLNKMKETGDLKANDLVPAIDVVQTDDGVTIYLKSQGITGDEIDTKNYRYFEMGPENDIDRFFKAYRKKISSNELKAAYKVQFLTSNAITLSNGLQIITRFCGSPEEIHANFDFIHATNYWTWDEGVVYNTAALEATLEKRLYYFGSRFPVASIFRMRKFVERGWRISAGEMLKIAYDVSHLNLDDVNELKQQSIGMDSAYFNEVIGRLQEKKDVDRTYLFQCIDEIFKMHDPKDNFLDYQEDSEVDSAITEPLEDKGEFILTNPLDSVD